MASPQRKIARQFLVEQGMPVRGGILASLTAELVAAERRGEDRGEIRVLCLIGEHIGADCHRLIVEKLTRDCAVHPLDSVAQSGDDVADRDRAGAHREVD